MEQRGDIVADVVASKNKILIGLAILVGIIILYYIYRAWWKRKYLSKQEENDEKNVK